MSSTGAEILCLMVPVGPFFVVRLRCGNDEELGASWAFLVVKARTRDMFADYNPIALCVI